MNSKIMKEIYNNHAIVNDDNDKKKNSFFYVQFSIHKTNQFKNKTKKYI